MKNFKLLQILLLIIPAIFYSQYKVNGRLLNREKKPVKNVELLFNSKNLNNSGKITTNDNGYFAIELKQGSYVLIIKSSEYKYFEKEIAINSDTQLENIELTNIFKLIEEVKLTSSPKMVFQKLDKTVVNIENNTLTNKGNVFETLKVVPGLVLKNDQISMLGRDAVKVMVDGRMINLSGDDLKSFLKSIPSESIKEVEVISNPSSKYEAEGNSGIVNLIFKKAKKDAWSNNTSFTDDVGKTNFFSQSINNNFTYQKDKISILLNTNYSFGDNYLEQKADILFSEPYSLITIQKINNNQFSGRLLLDYELTPKTKIGIQYLGSINNDFVNDNINTGVRNLANEKLYFLRGDGFINNKINNHSLNLHLEQKLDTLGRKLNIDVDYLRYNRNVNNTILSNKYDTENNYESVNFHIRSLSDQTINNYNLKFDIDHPGKLVNLTYGGKLTFTNTDYTLDNLNLYSDNPAHWLDQFKFNETIEAVYINGFRKFGDQWEGQIGLRAEYTQTKGYSVISDQTNYNKYFKLFPSLFIKYKVNDDNNLIFNYARRIQRPSYGQLNPARYFINSQISSMGNPYLKPSYVDNIEFSYIFKKLTSKFSFNVNSNMYGILFKMNDENKEQIVTTDNYFKSYGYSLMESYEMNPFPWWKTYTTIFLNYSQSMKIKDIDLVLRNGFEFFGSLNNSLTLNKSKTLTMDINYWYGSAFNQNLFHFSNGNALDLAFSYKTPYKGLNMSIAAYDIFNSSPRSMLSENNGVQQKYIAYGNNRFFRFSVNYTFGSDQISKEQRQFGNEEERERSR